MPKITLPIEIKISTVVAISTILHSADLEAIDSALEQMTGGVSDFFEDEFAVIDVAAIALEAPRLDWAALVSLLKKYRLNAVAVRGAGPAMINAIRAQGLAIDDGSSGVRAGGHATAPPPVMVEQENPGSRLRGNDVDASAPAAPETAAATPAPTTAPAPAPAALPVIVDTPVRAGQRIYARGTDLIVTAVVNNGAELIADGSIHVYAPLNGRALAGASGNPDARIFALSMQPELVSIAGVYRTFDEGFPSDLARQPTQIRLVGDRIELQSMAPAPRA